MSRPQWYSIVVTAALLVTVAATTACGGGNAAGQGEQRGAAAERARREAKGSDPDPAADGKSWGGWRYTGSRDDCFFVVGQRCFAEQDAACEAASCKAPQRCHSNGGGPVTITCE